MWVKKDVQGEATSTSSENPGGIFERVPEKKFPAPTSIILTNEKEPEKFLFYKRTQEKS